MTLINDAWYIIPEYVYNNEFRLLNSDIKERYDSIYAYNNYIYQLKALNSNIKNKYTNTCGNDNKIALTLIGKYVMPNITSNIYYNKLIKYIFSIRNVVYTDTSGDTRINYNISTTKLHYTTESDDITIVCTTSRLWSYYVSCPNSRIIFKSKYYKCDTEHWYYNGIVAPEINVEINVEALFLSVLVLQMMMKQHGFDTTRTDDLLLKYVHNNTNDEKTKFNINIYKQFKCLVKKN
jgi:hypothetical protein